MPWSRIRITSREQLLNSVNCSADPTIGVTTAEMPGHRRVVTDRYAGAEDSIGEAALDDPRPKLLTAILCIVIVGDLTFVHKLSLSGSSNTASQLQIPRARTRAHRRRSCRGPVQIGAQSSPG